MTSPKHTCGRDLERIDRFCGTSHQVMGLLDDAVSCGCNRHNSNCRPTQNPARENPCPTATAKNSKPFLTDVKTLRDRARQNITEGAMTWTYNGDPKQSVDILQSVLATEIVCVLRYTMHAVSATGISSDSVKAEFAVHAKEEQEHMMAVAERITQPLGVGIFRRTEPGRHDQGKPDRRAHRG